MIEILDTTLRDGEQTTGVSFNVNEKLAITEILLRELHIDYVEVASARVSKGEEESFAKICSWAASEGCLDRIEALAFVDGGESVRWIHQSGGKVANVLSKGSLKHLDVQLGKTREEHFEDISVVVSEAQRLGMKVNLYMEDWSNGMLNSSEYVFWMMDHLRTLPICRFMLPDTLGVLDPDATYRLCRQMVERYPDLKFDYHAHNDYGLAVANSLASIRAGIGCVHATVNGLGERSGNTSLAPLVASIKDHLKMDTAIDESRLMHACKVVSTTSNIRIPHNDPIIGENVFTQNCGVHADGDTKGELYQNALLPKRFGRERMYALGKLSGRANIVKNLERLGIKLNPSQIRQVTNRVVELGDKKQFIGESDLPFIVADVLKSEVLESENSIKIVNYALQLSNGMRPFAELMLQIHGRNYEAASVGDGQFDAFMRCLHKIYHRLHKPMPELRDFHASIPPGGSTDALVVVTISWRTEAGHEFKTNGIDSDQTEAAIKSTMKMLNLFEKMHKPR